MADIPGNSSTTATISVGGTVSSTLETLGDHDWFRITLTAGQSITIFVDGTTLEDPYLYVRNSSGVLIYENDDINPGIDRDSRLSFTVNESGTYYIDIGAWDENYTGNYTVSVSIYTPPPLATHDQIANQLVEGYWGGDDHHFNVSQGGSLTVNLTALTSAGQNLAREALKLWSDVIGVQFVEVTIGGQITFDDNQSGAFADGTWSGGITSSAHINVSTQWLANYGTGLNSYSFQTYIHEIGHALGLGHAGNYNGEATYPFDALFENDAWATSIMSYFSQTENTYFAGQGFTESFIVTPMIADIIAMSTLYGLSTTTRTGNTTYGFNSTAGRAVYDASLNPGVAYTIFDSGGTDTLDYSGFSNNQVINLNPETFSSVGPEVGNVSIARGVVIENAIGGSGNDTLIGNSVGNVLTGNNGNDTLIGGAGVDVMIGGLGNDKFYISEAGDVVTELTGQGDDWALASVSYALAAGVSVEVLSTVNGSATDAINLTGNEIAQSIYGNEGANTLIGLGGADYMAGGGGNDRYYTDQSDLVVELGGGGDDMIFVADSYILRDGTEVETLVAADQESFAPVNLTGNEFSQSLFGSQGANTLSGGAGNDHLVGFGGNDLLIGGAGTDHLEGGQGNDVYWQVDSLDWVNELPGQGDDLVVAAQSVALRDGESIETMAAAEGTAAINLTGNELNQSLYGNAGANTLIGLGGADYMAGGAGNDRYYTDQSDLVVETAGGGDDMIFVADSYILRDGTEIETLVALDQESLAPVNLTGNEFSQSLFGSQGANTLSGGGGNDHLVGFGGNDVLIGGSGADHLEGGQGNDVYWQVDSLDWVNELAGQGDDLVVAAQSFTLLAGDSVETLAAAEGSAAINLTGNALGQSLYGNAGVNVLTAGGGADYLVGGAGNDTFVLSSLATSQGNVATIGDYAGGEVVDITQILGVGAGTDPVAGGFVKVTTDGQLQVDTNGGGDSWTTIANVSGSAAVTVRYLSGGSATQVSVARSASQTAMMAGAVAAAGMAAMPAAAKDTNYSSDELVSTEITQSSLMVGRLERSAIEFRTESWMELSGGTREALDVVTSTSTSLAMKWAGIDFAPDVVATAVSGSVSALPQGTEVPFAQALAADAVAMPSAEQFHAATPAAALSQEHQLVAKVLLDALAGGEGGGPIDALLDSLGGSPGSTTGVEHLAQFAAAVDSGNGALTAVAWAQSTITAEALSAHPDAVTAA